MSENLARQLIEGAGGTVEEVSGHLPDGSGFMVGSFPLPKNHWMTADPEKFNVPPMPFKMGVEDQASLLIQRKHGKMPFGMDPPIRMRKNDFADKIREAGKYAVRCATENGKIDDFDPDALLQNLVVGMLGYWTDNGLSIDDFANPPVK